MTSHTRMVQPRLPGVYFRTVKPPPRETLPRMDIAAMIGFVAVGLLYPIFTLGQTIR